MAFSTRLRAQQLPLRTPRGHTVCCKCVVRPSSISSSRSSGAARWPQQAATAALAASLLLSPMVPGEAQAAKAQQLADLLKDEYTFVDANKDGVVTRSELQQFVKAVSNENNVPLVADEQLDFTMRLFDLNQDGKLTSEEVLRSLVLDGAVDDEAVDEDVFNVFDSNRNGTVEAGEFRAGLGDLGPNGDAAKDFVFGRVDGLTSSGGALGVTGFANALVLMRNVLLGY